jgi:hypothetical protein
MILAVVPNLERELELVISKKSEKADAAWSFDVR